MKRLCFSTTIGDMPIRLYQESDGRFGVTYWKQKRSGMSYSRAAEELGSCIMHACATEGKLDNSDIYE